MTRIVAAGARNAWLAFVGDTDNIIAGATAAYPAAGTLSHALPLRGIQTVPTGMPETNTVAVLGDDGVLGSFEFDSEQPTSFIINTGSWDLALAAALQRTEVESINGIDVGVVRPEFVSIPDVALLVQGVSKGVDGKSQWHAFLYPRCTVRPLGRESFASREAATFRYQVTAQPVSRFPTGRALTTAANGTTLTTALELRTDNPLTMAAFTGDGVVTVFSGLLRKPASTTITGSIVAVNGSHLTTGVGFDTVNNELEFATAPAAGARGVVIYGYVG